MREEIEAAALFITKLVNKNLSTSSASSTHSSSSSTSSSSSSSSSTSESPPGFDEVQTSCVNGQDQDKVEQFRQCLMKALYERFHNHWFPEQPTKGQAYRCIRLNEWDRHDTTLQQACLQCGIDYKDLQLPVELTLWVDPDEVTCRFGENKGSHCLVAKFKDGELKDKNLDIDINDINIELFRQNTEATGPMTFDKMRRPLIHGSPDYNNSKQHNQHHMINNNNNNNHINQNSSYHFHHQNSHHHHNNNNQNHHLQQQHQQQQHQQQQQQQQQAQQTHHLGKATILPSYHNNYIADNPIYYYF